MKISQQPPIYAFQNEYRFLSNFYPSPFIYQSITYPTVENFYQSEKTLNMIEKHNIINATSPTIAKRMGKIVELRQDWLDVRDKVMMSGLIAKFKQNPQLKKYLLETNNRYLIEGNNWGDDYWGYDWNKGIGDNRLGQMLMKIRYNFKIENPQF